MPPAKIIEFIRNPSRSLSSDWRIVGHETFMAHVITNCAFFVQLQARPHANDKHSNKMLSLWMPGYTLVHCF